MSGQRSIQPGGVRSKVNPAGGGGGSGQRSIQPGGGQVQPAGGGSGPAGRGWGGGSVPGRGGVRSCQRGGVSILRPLAGGMPLAFTQEDFLVV